MLPFKYLFQDKPNWLFLCLFAGYLFAFVQIGQWKISIYGGDSWGYYAHVPASFIYHDVGDYDKTIKAIQVYNPSQKPKEDLYGVRPAPTGQYAIKYSLGFAYLLAPAFFIAHSYCRLTGHFLADGFSPPPYALLNCLSVLLFAFIGLHFLFKNFAPTT